MNSLDVVATCQWRDQHKISQCEIMMHYAPVARQFKVDATSVRR
jgi:hypothetical protein